MKTLKLKAPHPVKLKSNAKKPKSVAARSNPGVKAKPIEVNFNGGKLTSDAGVVLLQKVDRHLGLTDRISGISADIITT